MNPNSDIQARFLKFHENHPEIYAGLVTLARQLKASGRQTYGIASLFEVMRWHRSLKGGAVDEGFKMNHNYRSQYSRLIMDQEPDLKGFFDVRELRPRLAA